MKSCFVTNFFKFILLFQIFIELNSQGLARKCRLGTRIPHPVSCDKYMVCGKTRGEFRCKSPLLYNHEIKSCDRASNVVCTRMTLNNIKETNVHVPKTMARSFFRAGQLNLFFRLEKDNKTAVPNRFKKNTMTQDKILMKNIVKLFF